MTQTTGQVQETKGGLTQTFGQIRDKAVKTWKVIRQRISAMVSEGIGSLIFAFDRGADEATPTDQLHRKKVYEAICVHFGDSPAELFMQASPEEREQLAMAFHVTVARALGIEESVVAAVDMRSGLCGTYSWQHDLLAINARDLHKQPMTLEEAKELMDTILHETYHSMQRKATVRPSRYGVHKSTARIWRINFKNYITPGQNPEQYATQPVEITATMFAGAIVREFYS